MAKQPSLIFIPDISGFTKFVTTTEVEHSGHIIAELLELLIDANELDMTLAEIEGDALFYFKNEVVPSKQDLMKQIKKMFIRFHSHLKAYEHNRICNCGACTTAPDLNLKFIIHAGVVDFIHIKDLKKPYGQEVILAHRLMKNNVPIDDYALLSGPLNEHYEENNSEDLVPDLSPQNSEYEYDLGVVKYKYYPLTPLRNFVMAAAPYDQGKQVGNPWTYILDINSPAEKVADLVINFENRPKWSEGVDRFEFEKDRVNRAGTKHQCVINGKAINFETVKTNIEGKLVFGEVTTDFPIADEMTTYFIFEPQGEDRTKLTIEVHPFVSSKIKGLLLSVLKSFIWKKLKEPFDALKEVAEKEAALAV